MFRSTQLRSTRSHVVFTIYVESRSRVESSEKVTCEMEHLGGVLILLMDENVYKLTIHDYTLNAIII